MRYPAVHRVLSSFLVTSIIVATMTGCVPSTAIPSSLPFAAGNWQFVSTTNTAIVPVISGALTGPSTNIYGLMHVDGQSACQPQSDVIEMTGFANQYAVVRLKGLLAGGTIELEGVLAADGRSLVNPRYSVTGGVCATQYVYGNGQNYSEISGTYTGKVMDESGVAGQLTTVLSQSSQPDANGNFQLSGQGTFTSIPCLANVMQLTNAEVTGSSLHLTYLDPQTQNSVTATGQVTPDGKNLAVTTWTMNGSCGNDSGTAQLEHI